MNQSILLILPILFPIVAGALVSLLKMNDRKRRNRYLVLVVVAEVIITLGLFLTNFGAVLPLLSIHPAVSFALHIDALSVVFGSLICVLWLAATIYAFGYMEHEGGEVRFFTFFTITLGITMGVALSQNGWTLYLFYELLTLVTYPLVTHSGTKEAMAAGRKYLIYSFVGAILVFVAMAFLSFAAPGGSFVLGGLFQDGTAPPAFSSVIFLIGFLGFGVKGAVFPLHGWLPSAYVAPSPVTALLHAVAVVKSGVFGMLRLAYFCFGTEVLRQGWAPVIGSIMALVTILYGSTMALRTTHLKKRLAYSTISQLSYMVFAAMMMSSAGLQATLVLMVAHAISKITLFFCCSSIMVMTGETDVSKMKGIGQRMPVTMTCFAIASLSLVGFPPTVGLISKWYLGTAAISGQNQILGMAGIGVIMISVLLTALYLLPFTAKAFLVKPEEQAKTCDPPKQMRWPVAALALSIVLLGVLPGLIAQCLTALNL